MIHCTSLSHRLYSVWLQIDAIQIRHNSTLPLLLRYTNKVIKQILYFIYSSHFSILNQNNKRIYVSNHSSIISAL